MDLSITELENNDTNKQNIKSILKLNTNTNTKNTKKVTYDDILAKMGMYVDNGKLHLDKNNNYNSCSGNVTQCTRVKCNRIQESLKQQQQYHPVVQNANANANINSLQNSYIYNKHFKNHISSEQTEPQFRPSTPEEYKQIALQKLIQTRLQQLRINKIKSTKLIMPTDNINIASIRKQANLNRLFNFSK